MVHEDMVMESKAAFLRFVLHHQYTVQLNKYGMPQKALKKVTG